MAKETKTELQKGGNGPQRSTHLMTPLEEMERMFENFMGSEWTRPMQWEWPRLMRMRMPLEGKLPRVDVVDRQTDILVRAELPGVD
jgi:HSP20 family protein